METAVTRVDDLEVASFIDRIALFAGAGCNPQQALRFCSASMEGESYLCRELRAAVEVGGGNCARVLQDVSGRLESEPLYLASLSISAHMKLGAEMGGPLSRLADMVRWQHHHTAARDEHSRRELAVALFAYKMDFLTEIGKSPKEAIAILAERDSILGEELGKIVQDLLSGSSLARSMARSGERMGSRGMKLLATAIEVGDATGSPRAVMLRQTADAIRRELEG